MEAATARMPVSPSALKEVQAMREGRETYDDVLRRLIEVYKNEQKANKPKENDNEQ